jgi:hypothetical protein
MSTPFPVVSSTTLPLCPSTKSSTNSSKHVHSQRDESTSNMKPILQSFIKGTQSVQPTESTDEQKLDRD